MTQVQPRIVADSEGFEPILRIRLASPFLPPRSLVFWGKVEKHVVLRATPRAGMHEVETILITFFYAPLRAGAGDVPTFRAALWMILEVRLHEVDE